MSDREEDVEFVAKVGEELVWGDWDEVVKAVDERGECKARMAPVVDGAPDLDREKVFDPVVP